MLFGRGIIMAVADAGRGRRGYASLAELKARDCTAALENARISRY
jgi:hypothetical protein